VPRAKLRLLQCKAEAQPFPHRLTHQIRLVAENEDDGGRLERAGRSQHVLQKWKTGGLVEHLRHPGLHPGPLAGGQNDNVVRHDG
jgi:hypothetical protein